MDEMGFRHTEIQSLDKGLVQYWTQKVEGVNKSSIEIFTLADRPIDSNKSSNTFTFKHFFYIIIFNNNN